jgi:hypothetical protein
MLNAHKDTDKNEIEDEQSYDGNPKKWKKWGNFLCSYFCFLGILKDVL